MFIGSELFISMTVKKLLPHRTDLLGRVKGQIFNFGKSVFNILQTFACGQR